MRLTRRGLFGLVAAVPFMRVNHRSFVPRRPVMIPVSDAILTDAAMQGDVLVRIRMDDQITATLDGCVSRIENMYLRQNIGGSDHGPCETVDD